MRYQKEKAPLITRDASGNYVINVPLNKTFNLQYTGGNILSTSQWYGTFSYGVTFGGKFIKYNNITVAGEGVPAIYKVASTLGNTAALSPIFTYTPPATAGTYRVCTYINVTAWTTPASFNAKFTYKDGSGNARDDIMIGYRGSTGGAATAITAVDRWYMASAVFQIDNSATAITAYTTGTFTGSPVYDCASVLEQLA